MQIHAKNPAEYIHLIPDERKPAFTKLRNVILENLPLGFEETIQYGMIGFVVPHSIYPAGYHCDSKIPLPFMSIASQKNFVAVYHMGIYADKSLMEWFINEYPKHCTIKMDMGKSCLRFKKPEHIPYELIGKLASKLNVEQWINIYETVFKR